MFIPKPADEKKTFIVAKPAGKKKMFIIPKPAGKSKVFIVPKPGAKKFYTPNVNNIEAEILAKRAKYTMVLNSDYHCRVKGTKLKMKWC